MTLEREKPKEASKQQGIIRRLVPSRFMAADAESALVLSLSQRERQKATPLIVDICVGFLFFFFFLIPLGWDAL